MSVTPEFDFKPAYKAADYSGVAWRVTGYVTENVYDEDFDGYEEVEDRTRVVAHMIGDDRNFTFDVDDLTPLADDTYCRTCGQVGCTHNVYE